MTELTYLFHQDGRFYFRRRVPSNLASVTCSIAQAAATAAFSGSLDCVHNFVKILKERRDLVFDLLKDVPSLQFVMPGGAFYLFVDCTRAFGQKTPSGRIIENDLDFTEYLLEDAGLAIVPGTAFGAPGHIRLSYAAANSVLIEGCKRLTAASLPFHEGSITE